MSKITKNHINLHIIKTVKQFFKEYQIDMNRSFTLSISGGLDSMCLLHIFEKLLSTGCINEFRVVHFNHQIRKESDTEEYELSKLLDSKSIPYLTQKLQLHFKGNVEMEARKARYESLNKFIDADDSYCCLGHNLNDHFEWSLMRMLRSSDTNFMQGMPKVRGRYLRPLSEISRGQLQQYAEKNNLTYWEDKSNSDDSFDRNFIRHQLVAKMAERFPNFLEHYRSRQIFLNGSIDSSSKVNKLKLKDDDLVGLIIDQRSSSLDLELIGSYIKKLNLNDRGSISRELIKLESAFFSGKQGPMLFSGGVKVWLNKPFIFIYNDNDKEKCGWRQTAQLVSLEKVENRHEFLDLIKNGKINSPFLKITNDEILGEFANKNRKIPAEFIAFLGLEDVFSIGALYNCLPKP